MKNRNYIINSFLLGFIIGLLFVFINQYTVRADEGDYAPTPTPIVSCTPTPEDTPSVIESPTASPSATDTPMPTDTPTSNNVGSPASANNVPVAAPATGRGL